MAARMPFARKRKIKSNDEMDDLESLFADEQEEETLDDSDKDSTYDDQKRRRVEGKDGEMDSSMDDFQG